MPVKVDTSTNNNNSLRQVWGVARSCLDVLLMTLLTIDPVYG